jgi:hypothetical protein
MEPRQRYGLIDFDGLRELFNFRSTSELANAYRGWVEESMKEGRYSRDGKWTVSIAVGKKEFVEKVRKRLGARAQVGSQNKDPVRPASSHENHIVRFGPDHHVDAAVKKGSWVVMKWPGVVMSWS